ncbi:protein usg [Devosia sp. A16]|uniref:protein usg n=1 Tax=Devosia sp. A16 TaxID=1736675 RepID=UPI0006D76AD0|nr:protein usg [Devosia sp. A16]
MSSWSSDEQANVGYGLTTAQIVYRMPDHRHLFQDFIWQRYDTYPSFPALGAFLTFWEETIEGPIHSVTVAHARLIRPTDLVAIRRAH